MEDISKSSNHKDPFWFMTEEEAVEFMGKAMDLEMDHESSSGGILSTVFL